MGPGNTATDDDMRVAHQLGALIAQQGWILLTGGRDTGVMDAASRGAKGAGGTVIGILPGADTRGMSPYVDIPIVTGMRDARNSINILSSIILFFIGMSPGTASELALAVKNRTPSILIDQHFFPFRFYVLAFEIIMKLRFTLREINRYQWKMCSGGT